ncbi:MAG TPA: ABC transporter substrate-binding protein, partial [Bradyrhizobium sp.]|nr:ABC transporter substrate-binding protein [Bradyrhizobium sp.]
MPQLLLSTNSGQAQGIPQDIPRKELLILENPEGTIKNAGWFNIWAINAGSQSNGLQQAALDTLWYIDPESGLDGVWSNSLAADKPQYNADFTEMTAKLRNGIFWSDGVEFTADDVISTVMTQIKNPGMRFSAVLTSKVASVDAPDPYTVVFKLKKPNSRFHTNFTVRWNAIWIMPKHVFEKVQDPAKFDFNKPVSLGAYVLNSYDPDGKWYIWQLRDDWQRTTIARYGKPGPKYLAYVDPGPPDKRVIAQLNHELDVIHDIAPEGMFALAKQSKSTRAWFKGFPYGHPDPTLPAVIFNTQNELFKNPDVRWALALLIDVKAVAMAAYRGAATISAIGVPPTGMHPAAYHQPMEEWLKGFEIDTGKRKVKPYDPTVGKQIADMLRPSMGEQIPADPKEIARAFGMGWWKTDPQAAQELLEKAGFSKRGAAWFTPDGKPFTVRVMVEGDLRPVMTRAGTMIVQQWKQAG